MDDELEVRMEQTWGAGRGLVVVGTRETLGP
jgi:hypothetical protein